MIYYIRFVNIIKNLLNVTCLLNHVILKYSIQNFRKITKIYHLPKYQIIQNSGRKFVARIRVYKNHIATN